MKRQLCLNRRLYELDLLEQNKYLCNKINSMKPVINTNTPFKYRNEFLRSSSTKNSKYFQ